MLEAKRIYVTFKDQEADNAKREITIAYKVNNGVAELSGDQKMIVDLVWLINNTKAKDVRAEILNGH